MLYLYRMVILVGKSKPNRVWYYRTTCANAHQIFETNFEANGNYSMLCLMLKLRLRFARIVSAGYRSNMCLRCYHQSTMFARMKRYWICWSSSIENLYKRFLELISNVKYGRSSIIPKYRLTKRPIIGALFNKKCRNRTL